jgi:hypothetical protein
MGLEKSASRRDRVIQAGDIAPEFELDTADGQRVSLRGVLHSGHGVLLIFLRHLGQRDHDE